jgi:ABC-type uncharacterized transport system substrate-binding protein
VRCSSGEPKGNSVAMSIRASRRRVLAQLALAGAAVVASRGEVAAQSPARVPMVGVLSVGPSTSPSAAPAREALERGLRDLGWVPGQTVRVDFRYAEGQTARLDALAAELTRSRVDVIVARSSAAIRAARKATATIPIVMSASGFDPVELGLVASFARPGGNVTGLTLLNQDLLGKQLQLLTEVAPRATRVTVLGSRGIPMTSKGRHELQAAAERLGVELQHVDLATAHELDEAFASMARAGTGGVVVRADTYVLEPNAQRVVSLALKHRLPAVYWLDAYADIGGLVSYGANLLEIHRRSAFYVHQILRGARAGDLPVEEPSTFELTVNAKTSRALGLTLPAALLSRASRIIQ